MRLCLTTNRYAIFGILTAAMLIAVPSCVYAASEEVKAAASTGAAQITDAMVKQALNNINGGKDATKAVTTVQKDAAATAGNATDAAAQAAATAAGAKVDTGSLKDPDSVLFKANALAEERKRDTQLRKAAGIFDQEELTGMMKTPPTLNDLQNIKSGFAEEALSNADTFMQGDISKDMRMDAMRNAALSYGARGGLAKRSYEIMEKMDDYAAVLDKVFDFNSLLIKAPSGMLIEPPIIRESLEAMVIKNGGSEAAVADTVLDINKNAKIVSAARNWRQYLIQVWSNKVAPPPKILWPQNDEEQAEWNKWVAQGWEAGEKQAEQIFELNTNRLASDYRGMVRYRILLAQGMVTAPYTTHEERGVVGDGTQMRIGDRAIKITEPSRFLSVGANTWRPADR